jgi:hypothetical protein
MQSMKVRGFRDAESVRTRALKLRALGRISGEDQRYITERAEEIMARIVTMTEVNGDGDSVAIEEG